ncbi:DUF3987 domain-containing protein [Xanthobacteraceae bacterium A53D]
MAVAEARQPITVASIFARRATADLHTLYLAMSDQFGGNLMVAPRLSTGGADWTAVLADDMDAPSIRPDWDELQRLFLLIDDLPGVPGATLLVNFEPLSGDRPVVRLKAGHSGDAELARALIVRQINPESWTRWEPRFAEAANDNEPPRNLPAVPPMMVDPLSPEAAGGLLADISRWVTSTAIVPVPELSMMAALALLAGLFGGKVLGPTRSGINLYATTLLDTAGGKGHPPKAIRALADSCGPGRAVTNGDHTSYAAIERTLRRSPSTVIVMDEFGLTLQDVNGRTATSASASIRKFLLAVYDQANSKFDGRIYASSESKKDDSPINGPALTVLGMTTPETLYAGLSEASIGDGFLNRFLFVSGTSPAAVRPPSLHRDGRPSAALVEALQAALTVCPKGGSGLRAADKFVVPFDGGEDGPAYRRWGEVFMWQRDPVWNATEQALNGRAAENTLRLATLRALSRSPAQPSIIAEDVEWGWAIVHASIELMTEGARRHMSSSPAEALRKAIVAALEVAPDKTLSISKLMERKGIRGADMRELDGALVWLLGAGTVVDLNGKLRPGRGSRLRLVAASNS